MNSFPYPNKLTALLFLFVPFCEMYFAVSQLYLENKENYLPDRLLPVVVTIFLLIYLAKQHYLYWDKSFLNKPYLSIINSTIAISFGVLLLLVLYKADLKIWYMHLSPSASTFYFLPFIISGYVIPLLLFSHIFADSLDIAKRIKYIGSAYLIIIVCFLFWWIRYTIFNK